MYKSGETGLVINSYHQEGVLSQGQHEDQLSFNISVDKNAEDVLGQCEKM